MVAMIADVHSASADRAGAVQDIEFPEGEVGVFRPAVGHGDHLAEASLGAGPEHKLCPRWVLAPWRAVDSEWLLAQRAKGWDVVDVHGPLKRYLARERERDPGFRLADDGVHVNATGHWLIARQILLHWGAPTREVADATGIEQVLAAHPHGREVLELVRKKQRLLKDAWLTATGHKRPGMKAGLPLEEADRQAGGLDTEIRRLLMRMP
jgi:hypothetical protein